MRSGKVMRRAVGVAAVASFLLAVPGVAATTRHVRVLDSRYDPASTSIRVGDTIHWMSNDTAEDHNVREDNRIFRSGGLSFNIDYDRVFSAGTFRYFCESHVFAGMKGVVKVPVSALAGPSGAPFTVTWATSASNTGSKWDVQYRVGSSEWKTWKSGTTARSAVFGADSAPVRAVNGKTYSFRARSKTSAARSDWSPIKKFTV